MADDNDDSNHPQNDKSADTDIRKEYVDNGLLFFIYNKVNCMAQDDILQLCKDFYNKDDIEEAKSIMYNKYGCPEKAKTFRGEKKQEN